MEVSMAKIVKKQEVGLHALDRNPKSKKLLLRKWRAGFKSKWQLYLMTLVPLVFLIIFSYIPMSYIIIAFKDFSIRRGILGSEWVGLKHFKDFFENPFFWQLTKNTLRIGLYGFLAGNVVSIFLAFAMNEIRNLRIKRGVQNVTFMPYFISSAVLTGILMRILDYNSGIVNSLLKLSGHEAINFMGEPSLFAHILVWSGIWAGAGFASVIYVSALSSVNPSLIEAAKIDGATRLQCVYHIDIPAILPTLSISLILGVPSIINVPFERIVLMQNALNASASEVIMSYIYKQGIVSTNYAYSTAVGLVNSLAGILLIFASNFIAKKIDPDSGLF
jgi:putative aldouronate transport system permease protein